MARPKGSKNKKTLEKLAGAAEVVEAVVVESEATDLASFDDQIDAAEVDIAAAKAALDNAKVKLKKLKQAKAKAEAAEAKRKAKEEAEAAKKKAEEEKAKLIEAIGKSEKSFEEVMAFLKGDSDDAPAGDAPVDEAE